MGDILDGSSKWDKGSSSYLKHVEPFTMLFAKNALELSGIPAKSSIIDICCGTGGFALHANK